MTPNSGPYRRIVRTSLHFLGSKVRFPGIPSSAGSMQHHRLNHTGFRCRRRGHHLESSRRHLKRKPSRTLNADSINFVRSDIRRWRKNQTKRRRRRNVCIDDMRSNCSNQTQPVLVVGVGSFPSVRRDRQDGSRLRVVGFQFGTDAIMGETWFIYFHPRSASSRVSRSVLEFLPDQFYSVLILLRISMPSNPAGGKAGRL